MQPATLKLTPLHVIDTQHSIGDRNVRSPLEYTAGLEGYIVSEKKHVLHTRMDNLSFHEVHCVQASSQIVHSKDAHVNIEKIITYI